MNRPSEHRMTTWDGATLFYRAWRPATPAKRALVLFHRGHEHSGRFEEFVEGLALDDVAVFAWDARGHGRSPGERGWAPSGATLVRDADRFVRHVATAHAIALDEISVLGVSVGAVLAAAWVHDYAPPIRALVLVSPAFRVRLWVPFARPALRALNRVQRRSFVQSYVCGSLLTHDPRQSAAYDSDPLVSRAIAVNVLLDLHDTASRLMADAGAIHVPTLALAAGADLVVDRAAIDRFVRDLGSSVKRLEVYPHFYHDVLHEAGRARPIQAIREFLLDAYDRLPLQPGTPNDENSRQLVTAPPPWTPAGAAWAIARIALRTVGRASRGIAIGCRHGFDSGASLDYVYRNRPEGITLLGRFIDRAYLNSAGWSAIRERRANLETLLRRTIGELAADGQPVKILDVAAGAGRYVLDSLRDLGHIPMTAVLRDADPVNVAAARRRAALLGLTHVQCTVGDAFDRASVASVRPRPTIAIVSGLWELFPDNRYVEASLAGVHAALADGGYLIYTNQPWHPQLRLIARLLTNREGRPWAMRCRPQSEIDALVERIGFEKVEMAIDDRGIFSVSVARKV